MADPMMWGMVDPPKVNRFVYLFLLSDTVILGSDIKGATLLLVLGINTYTCDSAKFALFYFIKNKIIIHKSSSTWK